MKKITLSPVFIGFLQTAGFLIYVTLVSNLLNNANTLFGPMKNQAFLAPLLFLSLFSFSAIISAALVFGYPFYIFWEKKNFNLAAKIVASSAGWLFVFILVIIFLLTVLR